jgi:hypothetical protein
MWSRLVAYSAEGKGFFLVLHLLNVGTTTGKSSIAFNAGDVVVAGIPSHAPKTFLSLLCDMPEGART